MQDSKLKLITDKAITMREIETEIKQLEKQLKAKQEIHTQLSAVELPELMAEIGLRRFTLDDGTNFSVKPVMNVSIPKGKMEEANSWLVDQGHDGMVRTTVILPRGIMNSTINKVVQYINQLGFTCETEKAINWQTLNKWAREMEAEEMVIPEDIFSIFRSNKTVIEG